MTEQLPEADKYLRERGIISDPEDKRTTLEIAQAFGFRFLNAADVKVGEEIETI